MLIFYSSFLSSEQVYSLFFQMNEFLVIWKFKKASKYLFKYSCFSQMLKKVKNWQISDFSFNSIKACFVALEQRGSTRNDTFSWF